MIFEAPKKKYLKLRGGGVPKSIFSMTSFMDDPIIFDILANESDL